MDVLSQALATVRMTGAIFFNLECSAPWGFAVPPVRDVGNLLSPGTERLVSYHLITDGKALVQSEDVDDLWVTAGDIVVVPHGDAHTVMNGAPATLVKSRVPVDEVLSGTPSTVRLFGAPDGDKTRVICGFLGCEQHADRLFLAGLPRLFKVHLRDDEAGAWLESSVRHLATEAASARAGTAALLAKLAEALFVETLRRYMNDLPAEHRGWLAAARDPVVGAALALLHREPCRAWSVPELAAEVGASRSVLGERFAQYLDEPPLAYLVRWRLQLAARRLETTRKTVLEVGLEVGYQSESAFNRAFKREFGLPPAQYRKRRSLERSP